MRVAILCFGTTGRGGMETVMATLLRQFGTDGDVGHLFLLGGSKDELWLSGLPVTVIGSPGDGKARRYLRYTIVLPGLLREFMPDLILCADPRAVLVAAFLKKVLRLKALVVSWLHFTLEQLSGLRNLCYADAHFAISAGIADELRLRGFDKVYLVHNPVVLAVSKLQRSDIVTFLYVGRLTMEGQKRTDDFLRALALLHGSFKAVVIGGGQDESDLKKLAAQLGLAEKIEWLGWQQSPWRVAPPCTVFVMTSAYEGFAMALAEAISHGLPALSTDCKAGPSDIIVPDKNGWLFPVGDIQELSNHMQRIIDVPTQLPPADHVARTVVKFSAPSVTSAMRAASNFEMSSGGRS